MRKPIFSYQEDIQQCKKELTFQKIYLQILNEEVAPNSFTPESLLNDIVNKCFWNFSQYGIYEIYPLQKIIRISNQQLKNKQKFLYALNHVLNQKDFAINIIYLKNNNKETYLKILEEYSKGYIYADSTKIKQENILLSINSTLNYLNNNFFNTNIKAINLNSFPNKPKDGCLIVINGQLVKTHRDFESVFDHQLNHYFDKIGFFEGYNKDINYNLQKIIENNKINTLLNKYYKFNNDKNYQHNIKLHLYNDSEFYSMCATVFHTLLKEIQKFNCNLTEQKFLNMLNYNFINQDKFINQILLNHDLREAIIFCFVNKQLAPDRFNIIKRGINTVFKIKKNIFQKFFIKTRDLIRNIICEEK